MLFSATPLRSALVAMVSLSIFVSGSLHSGSDHLFARIATTSRPGKDTTGKLAPPINLGSAPVSSQAIFKLTGEDLHTKPPPTASTYEQSNIVAQGKKFPKTAGVVGETGPRAHCYLGYTTANIRRVRYTMTIKVDRDESGATTVAEHDTANGAVIKATSGLYSHSDPEKGPCAKTLARHGEACANRPYIVPQSAITKGSKSDAATSDAGAGVLPPLKMQLQLGKRKRSLSAPLSDWKDADRAPHLVFRREAPDHRDAPDHHQAYVTSSNDHISHATSAGGTVCIDTVKRDEQVIKVVPTSALPDAPTSASHHVELVRSDEKQELWNQIIYNDRGEPIDVTHLSLSSNMSFWRAEYLCASCQADHQKHTVLYENVEIEVDELDAHAKPGIVCEGQAKATQVQKKGKQDGGMYRGVVFSIDRVALGMWDSKGHGGVTAHTEGKGKPFAGVLPTEPGVQLPSPKESKKTQPISVNKREVEVEDEGPLF